MQKNLIDSARRALRSTELGIEDGSRSVLELLNAQRSVNDAETNYKLARFRHI